MEALISSTYQDSAATWPFTAISTVLFGMRAFSRLRLNRDALGWDDFVIAISWVLDIVRASVFQKALTSTRQLTEANLQETVPTAAFWVIFTDAWAFLSIALPKLGVGILIIRLFRPQRWLQASILTLCVALNVLALVGFIITFVQCDPVAGQWNPYQYPKTKCWDRSIQIIYACSVSGISAFMDLAFSVYPAIVVWRLQMSTMKKLGAMALMGLGPACFAFAVVKLQANTLLLGDPDVNKLLSVGLYIGIWNSIENDFVLSAACLPSIPPFFRACKSQMKTHLTSSSFTRRTDSPSFRSLHSSRRSSRRSDDTAVDFASNGQLPEIYAGKIEVDSLGSV